MNNQLQRNTNAQLPELGHIAQPNIFRGTNLVEENLIIRGGYPSPEAAIADYRARHSFEKTPFRRIYTAVPDKGKSGTRTIRYLLDREGRQKEIVGKVAADSTAQILVAIGNGMAGAWWSSIGFEVYGDPRREELIACGRIDQWDLLRSITPEEWEALPADLRPVGNWDFDRMLWPRHCSLCRAEVVVNSHVFNIDSAVCASCGNRPWLTPSLHRYLQTAEECGIDREEVGKHALGWLSHVGGTFKQVRLDPGESESVAMRRLWNNSIMAKALDPKREKEVAGLLSVNTVCDLSMFQACARKLEAAFTGQTPFLPEHQIAAQFVFSILNLVRQRRLSTSEN